MRRVHRDRRGQGLVEFSLILIPFLMLMMGVFDLGRGIYANNAVAQAAREIARVTSVHPGATIGGSVETADAIATQRRIVLGLSDPAASITFSCTDMSGTAADCEPGNFVRVQVSVPFQVLTPLLSMVAPSTLSSTSHVQIEGAH